jgi:hypothetical protein
MSLPNSDNLKNFDFVFGGQPFVRAASKSTIVTNNYDVIWQAQPYVAITVQQIQLSASNVVSASAYSPSFTQQILIQTAGIVSASAIPPKLAQIYFSSPASASALTGSLAIEPSILVGIPDLGANAYDNIDRAQPFDPYMAAGDQINRAEPVDILGPTQKAILASRGIAAALAPGLSTELANYATITIGPASAVATANAMSLELQAQPETAQRIRVGQSGTKRALREKEDETIVGALLIRVNGKRPANRIEGFVRIINKVENISTVRLIEGMTVRTRKPWEDIKIKITRVA